MTTIKSVIKLYAGEYVSGLGYPFVLVVSQWMRRTNEHGAEVHFIIQQVPEINTFKLEQTRMNADLTRDTLERLQISDPEAFVEKEAREWAGKHLAVKRRAPFDSKGMPVLVDRDQLREEPNWKEALLRLRLRGLPDGVVEQIKQSTEADELMSFLHSLRGVQPIVVNDVPKK